MTFFRIVTLSESRFLQASRGGAYEQKVEPDYFFFCLQRYRKCFALDLVLEETLVVSGFG